MSSGLKEWSSNEDDLISKCYVYGYLLGRNKLILDIEETLYLLQQCSSTLMFISYGITEECFYEKDISNSILLLESNLSNSVNKLSSILGFNN